jgi:hypothetical protein
MFWWFTEPCNHPKPLDFTLLHLNFGKCGNENELGYIELKL